MNILCLFGFVFGVLAGPLPGASYAQSYQARTDGQAVEVTASGRYQLNAESAQIHGQGIRFDDSAGMLTGWTQTEDSVSWTIRNPVPGPFEVLIKWAVPDEAAGNQFSISTSEGSVSARMPSTGGHKNILSMKMGQIPVGAGDQTISMSAGSEIRGEVGSLKSIELIPVPAIDANRLTYTDTSDPFYVGLTFPRLVTPQWIGEDGVDAVVILGIDDLRDNHDQFENYLRPILERLKQIDGRAPVSIFSNALDPEAPILQQWLGEGLSLELHTMTHPCPILADGDFEAAEATFYDNLEWLNALPGNSPVAVRTPCMDSMNSTSPRLFTELYNGIHANGQFIEAGSSVVNIFTADDTSIPPEWIIDSDGRGTFSKYLPNESFATTVENYPYPFVIGNTLWEFPALKPSDWEAQHMHGNQNPETVADWKTAVDITVLKQGVSTLVFHPYEWIAGHQVADLVDYADLQYGSRIKFLTFPEAVQRLTDNLLDGHPLRSDDGSDHGVRLVDVNNNGFLDVIISNETVRQTRTWDPEREQWTVSDFPASFSTVDESGKARDTGLRFGIVHQDGQASMLVRNEHTGGAWSFDGSEWVEDESLLNGLEINGEPILTSVTGTDRGVRLRDINNNGVSELIVSNENQNAVFRWNRLIDSWEQLALTLPIETSIVNAEGQDNGLRFVDINENGYADVLFSNEHHYSLHLFEPDEAGSCGAGWTRKVLSGPREEARIPMIVRGGPHPNNGVWFNARRMWIQNEDTSHMPDVVDRRSFDQLLGEGPNEYSCTD